MTEKIVVIGLGYVGLPVALAFAQKYSQTVGFDVDDGRVNDLSRGYDWSGETSANILKASRLRYSSDEKDLKTATFYVVCVPTPIDREKRPDFEPLRSASKIVGKALTPGAVVVYESTVYPGATEEICGAILEACSGLKRGKDFKVGYSPERINPGDNEHSLERIIKVVSGEDEESLERIAAAYGSIITAGVYRASSIRVAEAAKVIENTQRDLNIALMNELALIFERLGIRTKDVLEAAGTKWNFLKFAPGLVGGHCIGVDPYYLTSKAESIGYHPEVILAGRRINDNMGTFIAAKLVRLMSSLDVPLSKAYVGVLGLAFKENIRDLRNSRVPDIVNALKSYGIQPLVCDPLADPHHAFEEYGIRLVDRSEIRRLNGLVLAVPHRELIADPQALYSAMAPNGVIVDVKSALDPTSIPSGLTYWCL